MIYRVYLQQPKNDQLGALGQYTMTFYAKGDFFGGNVNLNSNDFKEEIESRGFNLESLSINKNGGSNRTFTVVFNTTTNSVAEQNRLFQETYDYFFVFLNNLTVSYGKVATKKTTNAQSSNNTNNSIIPTNPTNPTKSDWMQELENFVGKAGLTVTTAAMVLIGVVLLRRN